MKIGSFPQKQIPTNRIFLRVAFFGCFGQNFGIRGAEHHKRATLCHFARVMRVAVPIPAVASASVFHSAAGGGSVVDVVRPL